MLFIIIEMVGFIGISWPKFHELTLSLTPLNLLFLAFTLLSFHKMWNIQELIWLSTVFLVGFFVEVLGVYTGKIFGSYNYGQNLGPKLFQVPISMGINWLLMCYTSVRFVLIFKLPNVISAIISALVMVGLDFIMEPVAMAFDYWQWTDNQIPLQNYVAWFVVAFFLNLAWFSLKNKGLNNFSNVMLLYLVVFFGVMHLQFAQ